MKRVITVAGEYLMEVAHHKAYYGVAAAVVILTLMLPFLPTAGVGIQLDLFREASLGLGLIMTLLIALVLGSTAMRNEMNRRTIYNSLSKGVRREEYYLGKFVGICAALLLSLFFFWLVVLIIVLIRFQLFNPGLAKAFFTIWLEGCLVASICLWASMYFHPFISVLIGTLFYVVGHVKGHVLYRAMTSPDSNLVGRVVAGFFYFILPNLEKLNINETVAHGERVFPVGAGKLALLTGLALSFVAAFVLLGMVSFRSKDL